MPDAKTLRLILGDQLNENHSWFKRTDKNVTYVLMEIRQETDYVAHHIQKVAAFFAAMRAFAKRLRGMGHQVVYLKLDDSRKISEDHEAVQQIKQWLDEQMDAGRFGEVPADEIMEQVKKHLPQRFGDI